MLLNHVGKILTELFKNFVNGFYNSVVKSLWVSWKNSKNSLNFCFYHYQLCSKSPTRNRNLKVCANWITCSNSLSLILSSVLENQVNLCYEDRKTFSNMSDTFLNSKICPVCPMVLLSFYAAYSVYFIYYFGSVLQTQNALNQVGHVGETCGSFSRVIFVGHSCGSNSWVILASQTCGPFPRVKLTSQTHGSFLVKKYAAKICSFSATNGYALLRLQSGEKQSLAILYLSSKVTINKIQSIGCLWWI